MSPSNEPEAPVPPAEPAPTLLGDPGGAPSVPEALPSELLVPELPLGSWVDAARSGATWIDEPAPPLGEARRVAPAGQARAAGLRVAYLVNRYPAPSHSFIRREIEGLEAGGARVERYAIRPVDTELPDPRDQAEQRRTRTLLGAGALELASGLLEALRSPRRLLRAAVTAARLGWRSERGLLRHGAYLAEAALLARWLRRSGADHLHAHFGTNPATVALLCEELGGPPWSFTAHGPEEFDAPGPLGLGLKVERARFAVGVSSFGRSQLLRHGGLEHARKVHVVRCGLDPAMLDRPPSPVPAAPRLVCVGRLCADKCQGLLIEAVAALVASGKEVELELVGDGPTRPALEAQVRRLGLEKRVHFTGWASSAGVRAALLEARALVLPSAAEGLPIVLMEALALGRPVVTTWVAGIPELVQPGVSGWLVPSGSREALVEALRAVLAATPAELARMAAAGRARVLEAHDARRSADALRTLFEGQGPGPRPAERRTA